MRIWTQANSFIRAINSLADSMRALAAAINELARVTKAQRR